MQGCYFCIEKVFSRSMRSLTKRVGKCIRFFDFLPPLCFCCRDFSKLYFCYIQFLQLSTHNSISETISGPVCPEKTVHDLNLCVRFYLLFLSKSNLSRKTWSESKGSCFFFAQFLLFPEKVLRALSRVYSVHRLQLSTSATRLFISTFCLKEFTVKQNFWQRRFNFQVCDMHR